MNNSGITEALKTIYQHLPLCAEEGGEFDSENIRTLIEYAGFTVSDQMETCIQLVENLFTSVNVLDPSELKKGRWRFKSFPGSLMARSLLVTLMDPNQSIYSSDFWNAQNAHSSTTNAQRNVLQYIESQREKNHAEKAEVIRYVHVAWGVIVVDGLVLLRHREDDNRKQIKNYVLVGGRLSQQDLRDTCEMNAVRVLQSPAASDNQAAIEIALKREMQEETGLDLVGTEDGYTYSPFQSLKAFTKVEGGGASHALTEYRIHLFSIKLTQKALFKLYESVNDKDMKLSWVTLEELGNGKSHEGKEIFLDALFDHYGGKTAWAEAVKLVPPSFNMHYRFSEKKHSVTIPLKSSLLEIGITGKEKIVDLPISTHEVDLIAGMSLIASGAVVSELSESIELLGGGWIKIVNEQLQYEFKTLALKLAQNELPLIDSRYEQYFRLDIDPKICFLDEKYFSWFLNERNYTLTRNLLKTPLGIFENDSSTVGLSHKLSSELARFATGDSHRTYECDEFLRVLRRDVRDHLSISNIRVLARNVFSKAEIKIPYKG